MNTIIHGDCLDKLKELEENSVDAIVTDPPYGLSFMGKHWDYDVPSTEIWKEALRVLKPGGYLLSFAGTRTQHRMAVNIEDAGFEIRDMIAWIYGSGFPKSLNIGKAVDKLQGNEREVVGGYMHGGTRQSGILGKDLGQVWHEQSQGTSEWEGWGTALKPALEPITVARKPLSEKTVAENCLKWGVGGINIDGSRVGTEERTNKGMSSLGVMHDDDWKPQEVESTVTGRFPANLIHDGSDEVVSLFPITKSGAVKSFTNNGANQPINLGGGMLKPTEGSEGSASRFFYCAKASKSERNKGCEELKDKEKKTLGSFGDQSEFDCPDGANRVGNKGTSINKNNHPTVKPIALMEYLVKLVSKENAIVLDPFAGSGSTLLACKNLNRNYIGIEREADYIEIINKRLEI